MTRVLSRASALAACLIAASLSACAAETEPDSSELASSEPYAPEADESAVSNDGEAVDVEGKGAALSSSGPYEWIDVATSKCLDSNTNRSVYTLGCNGGSFQKWTWSGSRESVEHRNLATGFCLDSNTSGSVYTLQCNGGNFQRWRRSGEQWINVATGRCLDSNTSGRVYTLPCNGGSFQRWK